MAAPVSANVSRALEQVKMGLYMLYGASYFNEDEWIKIDGLIHKGKYVFTSGPANILDSENGDLLSFDDPNDRMAVDVLEKPPFDNIEEKTIVVTESQVDAAAEPQEPIPAEIPQREPVAIPAAGGLALGYTQAQLDEIKAFNASLTKAKKKGKPKCNEDEQAIPHSSQPAVDTSAPSEHEARRISREKQVNVQPATAALSTPSSPQSIDNSPPSPVHPPPVSRPTNNTWATPSPPASQQGVARLKVAPGTKLIALRSQTKLNQIQLEIQKGDTIQIIGYVSGITHTGLNMRTRLRGQLSEDVFQKSTGHALSSKLKGLDGIEQNNAAAWDEVPVTRRSKPPAEPEPKPKSLKELGELGGLNASRFARYPSTESGSEKAEFMSRKEISKIIAQILASQNTVTSTTPSHRGSKSRKEPCLPVTPRTHTCWFWATPNRDCRFTADECRDLHAFVPGVTPHFHNGKPTWGSIADYPTPSSNLSPATPSSTDDRAIADRAAGGVGSPSDHAFKSKQSCFYWATNGNCKNTAEVCRYLHAESPHGVAPQPGSRKWKKSSSWTRADDPTPSAATDEFGRSNENQQWRVTEILSEDGTAGEQAVPVPAADDSGELDLVRVVDVPPPADWQNLDDLDPRGWGQSAQKEGLALPEHDEWPLSDTWDTNAADLINAGWGEPNLPRIQSLSANPQMQW